MIVKDAVGTGPIVAGKKESMMSQLRIGLVDGPVEHDSRAGELLAHHPPSQTAVGQQPVIDIGQVGVGDDNVGLNLAAVLKDDAGGTVAVDRDLLDRRFIGKARAVALGNSGQTLNNAVHAADGEPHPVDQLGVLQHRVGSR